MQLEKSLAALAAVLVVASSALAQPVGHASQHLAQAGTAAMAGAAMADGEVRKVDKDAGKITIRHGELKSLDMPAMTMVFQVKDKAMLDRVKVGDRVRFAAERAGGAFTVTAIEAAN